MKACNPPHRTDCLESYQKIRVADFAELITLVLSDDYTPKGIGSVIYTWQKLHGKAQPPNTTLTFTIDKPTKRITFSYTVDNEPCELHTFSLVAVPFDNFGNGLRWYFETTAGTYSKQLYYCRTKWVGRTEMKGIYYRQQYLSAPQRKARKQAIAESEASRKYVSIYLPKYFKKRYNNKPTKRYLYLIKKGILLPPKGKK